MTTNTRLARSVSRLKTSLGLVRAHLVTATGPRAVPGSQQPPTPGAVQANSTLSVRSNALRAGDGSRSVPCVPPGAMVAVSRCARLAISAAALLLAVSLMGAERRDSSRGAPARSSGANRSFNVDRSNHGTIRHVDTHVVQRPVEVRHEPEHRVEARHEVAPRHDVIVHRDVDVDVHRPHFWNNFSFGRRLPSLPLGFLSLRIGGTPYYYDNGIYYQPVTGGYQEVYPPVGAAIPQPPDGAIEIDAGGQTYYYAGGAFYLQQPDGTFTIAPTPIGVVVPELPPGAIQVSVNGNVAYQFNGIYYEPVFVNGVTQYQTFVP